MKKPLLGMINKLDPNYNKKKDIQVYSDLWEAFTCIAGQIDQNPDGLLQDLLQQSRIRPLGKLKWRKVNLSGSVFTDLVEKLGAGAMHFHINQVIQQYIADVEKEHEENN